MLTEHGWPSIVPLNQNLQVSLEMEHWEILVTGEDGRHYVDDERIASIKTNQA